MQESKEAKIDTHITQTIEETSNLPSYIVRFLSFLVAAILFGMGIYTYLFDLELWWVAPFSIAYPALSHLLVMPLRRFQPGTTDTVLMLIDSLIYAGFIILMSFSVIPSLFLILIISVSIMTLKGIKGWFACFLCISMCLLIYNQLAGPFTINHKAPELIFVLVASIACVFFLTTLAYFAFNQAHSLKVAQQALAVRQHESAALSRKLSKYLPPQVWSAIFTGQTDVKLQTKRKKLTIFFSDIQGFSTLSEKLQPEALTELLNCYFTEMSQIALEFGGTIDKFVGDAILIFFGDPTTRGTQQDALACVSMAIEMRKRMKLLHHEWHKLGADKPLQIRMGINTGYCTVGNFGTESRMDYTIIGEEVNLASRLESVAQPSEIVISESTYNLIGDKVKCKNHDLVKVKGFSKPVPVFEVIDHRSELGTEQSFIECSFDGFTLYADIDKIQQQDVQQVVRILENTCNKIKEDLTI